MTYYVHSSVPGGVVAEVNSEGHKQKGCVYAGAQLIARQEGGCLYRTAVEKQAVRVPQRLVKNSKLTNRQLDELVKYFALEVPASRAAEVMSINRHSAARVYHIIRRRCLARECELHSPPGGEVECDESYFGARRTGVRGR